MTSTPGRAPTVRGQGVSEAAVDDTTSTARRIEKAAVELFYSQGFSGTSVRQIADACGMAPGSLYNHYPSKERLLQAMVVRTQQDLNDRLDAICTATRTAAPGRQLHALMSEFATFHTLFPRESLVANSEWRSIQQPHQADVLNTHRAVRKRFEDVIRAGCASGEFRLPAPGDETALKVVVVAMINMGMRIAAWYLPHGPMSAADVAEIHAALAVAMVAGTAVCSS